MELKVARILSEVLGREIEHVKLSQAALAARMQEVGVPAEYAGMLAGMDGLIAEGGEERLNEVVVELIGKAPRGFREFAEAEKACWL